MFTKVWGWVQRLKGAAQHQDIREVIDVAREATELYEVFVSLADLPVEAQKVFKEQKELLTAFVPVLRAYYRGELPLREDLDRIQGERVEAYMALGKLIGSLRTRD